LSSRVKEAELDHAIKLLAENRTSVSGWTALYRLTWPFVVGTIFRSLHRSRDNVEDVSQDVFYRLVKSCDFSAFPNSRAFLGYLHAVCKNAARDLNRKRSTTPESHGDVDQVASSGQEQLQAEARLRLERIFSDLERDDLLLVEYLLEGYTLDEIATLTNGKYGALAVRIHRLKARLREQEPRNSQK
jgi:RNA polymerase sigma factor (sigma-70 family)